MVVAWGGDFDLTTIPDNVSNVTAIACGAVHTMALKSDGTVVAWGDRLGPNNYGQIDVPSGLSNVTAIAAGTLHSLALMKNGTVVAWGAGIANTQIAPDFGQSIVPLGLSNVTAIAAGQWHSVALKKDGTVVVWGWNYYGQTNLPVELTNVVAIAANLAHSVALKSDGTVVAWGSNGNGQTDVPVGLSNVIAVAAGFYHTVALKSDGTVVTWGLNYGGVMSVPADLNNAIAISAGGTHTLALKNDGTLVAWGSGAINIPVGLNGVMAIASGASHDVALVPVKITSQPINVTVNANSNATFSVMAFGNPPLSYQWFKDGIALSEATNSTLIFIAANRSFHGNYSVQISNISGSVTSLNATLHVLIPQHIESPIILGNGRVQLDFQDEYGGGIPDDFSRLALISTDELLGDNTVWTPITSDFTITNGHIMIEDAGATNAAQRFYRVIEW